MNKIFLLALISLGLLFGGVSQAMAATAKPRVYKINHVAPYDSLDLRSVASVKGKVLATIPHNGKGILSTGKSQKVGRSTWVQVHWSGKVGWVNKYFLLEDVHTTNYNPGQKKREKTSVFMQCVGTEPFWTIKITESQLEIKMMDGGKYQVPVEFRKQSANNTSIAVVAGRRGTALTSAFLQKVEVCSDGMSDKNFPYSITAMLNGNQVVSGCCSIAGAK